MKKLFLILLMAMAMCMVVSCDTHMPEGTEDGVSTTLAEAATTPQADLTDVSGDGPSDPGEEPTEAPTDESVSTEKVTEVSTEEPTEVPTEQPTEVSTEEPTEVPADDAIETPAEDTTEPIEDGTEEETPMPATAVDALMTYTDVLPSNIASYKRKLEDVPVERVMEAIEYIETASEKLGVVNEGGYYLEGGDYKIYLRRKITFSLDTTDGDVVWQILSYVLRDNSQES